MEVDSSFHLIICFGLLGFEVLGLLLKLGLLDGFSCFMTMQVLFHQKKAYIPFNNGDLAFQERTAAFTCLTFNQPTRSAGCTRDLSLAITLHTSAGRKPSNKLR